MVQDPYRTVLWGVSACHLPPFGTIGGVLVLVCLLSRWWGDGVFGHAGRIVGAGADAVEGAGKFVSGAFLMGGNASVEVASLAVAAVSYGASIAQDAWRGFEVSDTTVLRTRGRLAAADAASLGDYLASSAGRRAYSLDNDSALLIMDIAEGLSIAVPHLQVARLVAHTDTHLMEARVEARILRSGWLAIDFALHKVDYQVTWVNPAWDLAG